MNIVLSDWRVNQCPETEAVVAEYEECDDDDDDPLDESPIGSHENDLEEDDNGFIIPYENIGREVEPLEIRKRVEVRTKVSERNRRASAVLAVSKLGDRHTRSRIYTEVEMWPSRVACVAAIADD